MRRDARAHVTSDCHMAYAGLSPVNMAAATSRTVAGGCFDLASHRKSSSPLPFLAHPPQDSAEGPNALVLLSALHRTARMEDLTRIRIVGPGQTPSPCPIVRKSASPVASLFPACAAACCLPTAIPPALPHSLPPASAVVSWSLFPNAKAADAAGSREKGRRSAVPSIYSALRPLVESPANGSPMRACLLRLATRLAGQASRPMKAALPRR